MPDGVFRVVIIGAGGISGAHSGAIKASGGRVALAAAVDPHAENLNKLLAAHDGAIGFSTIDAFLKARAAGQVQADGAVICTPPSIRIKLVEACLKAGLHVLSEKPLAHTLADARKLAAIARKYPRRKAFVAYCHRYAPAVARMKELVSAGKIGQLVRFENVFACDLPGHKDKWFSDPKKAGGGAYLDMGSHSVDLFHFMVGQAQTVGAVMHKKWKGRTETNATVLLKSTKAVAGSKNNKPGVAGHIVSGWAETCRFTLALVGDAGMLFYDYERPNELVFKDLSGKAETHAVETHDVRFTRQMLAFADAAQGGGGKGKTALAGFDDGLAAAAAFDQALKLGR